MMILRWLDKMMDRIFVVLGALILLQMPLFMQQYHLSLQGHAKELDYQIEKINQAAQKSGKTLTEWIKKFATSSDSDFAQQGILMEDMLTRRDELSTAMSAWQNASPFKRPFVFLHYYKTDIVNDTWKMFQFGIPFNLEGLAYGAVGILLGYMMYCTISLSFRIFFGLFRRKPKTSLKTT